MNRELHPDGTTIIMSHELNNKMNRLNENKQIEDCVTWASSSDPDHDTVIETKSVASKKTEPFESTSRDWGKINAAHFWINFINRWWIRVWQCPIKYDHRKGKSERITIEKVWPNMVNNYNADDDNDYDTIFNTFKTSAVAWVGRWEVTFYIVTHIHLYILSFTSIYMYEVRICV